RGHDAAGRADGGGQPADRGRVGPDHDPDGEGEARAGQAVRRRGHVGILAGNIACRIAGVVNWLPPKSFLGSLTTLSVSVMIMWWSSTAFSLTMALSTTPT